ncbi:ABC transporter substrate-binding protein [Thauera phenylacetica]
MSPPRRGRRAFLHTCAAGLLAATLPGRAFGRAAPVRIGVDAEFMDPNSTADDAVLFGAQAAVDDLNARGGVLGGRPLQLVTSDNRSVPARGVANLERLGAERDVVGVLCGKFSPVVIEQLPTLHALRLPLLDPWAAADTIIDNGQRPNYAFRMGLSDTLAIDALLGEIERRKLRRIGLLAPQTAWGRSCQYAAERYIASRARQRLEIVGIEWHRWGAHDSIPGSYRTLLELGADALLLIANEPEGAALVKGLAGMPAQALRPIFSHWGISGGRIPGTGLGLSLVKEIMKLHGGSVSLESTPDAGTCATLWFPVTAQQGTALARSRAGL